MRFQLALGGAVFLSIINASDVWAYCSEPSAPSCASGYGNFDDEWEFNNCKSEMESYQSNIEDFVRCKQGEVDDANGEAEEAARKAKTEASEAEDIAQDAKREVDQVSSEYRDAVRDFNQRAGG